MALHLLRNSASSIIKYCVPRQLGAIRNVPTSQFRAFHLSPCLEKVISFNLSDIGEGIREVVVKEWFVNIGDTVEQFQNICEVQSDKATVTITSRYDGKITKIYRKIDEVVLVGTPLVDIDVEDEGDDSSSSSDSDKDTSPQTVKTEAKPETDTSSDEPKLLPFEVDEDEIPARNITPTTPAVRRIAKQYNVDLSKVPATGRGNRVLKGDVLEYLGHIPPGSNIPHPTLLNQKSPEKVVPVQSDRTEPLKGVRKAMLKAMTETLKIPHFVYSDEIDMTKLVEFRDQLKDVANEHGVPKLTYMPFCIKAASIALKRFPIINSSLDVVNESVIYKGAHNISVAIDTPQGLVVPNIKNCQLKSILQIAKDLNALVEKGRAGTLRPEDFADGTFSLSNIGIVGGTYTHPCIMAPQVSIGAIGRTKPLPRFNDKGEVVKAYIMNVSWSADHRVIDGVTMASFSNVWKKYLENPALFLIDGN